MSHSTIILLSILVLIFAWLSLCAQVWNFKAKTVNRTTLSYTTIGSPIFIATPFILVEMILHMYAARSNLLTEIHSDILGDLSIIGVLMLVGTYILSPRVDSSDKTYLKRGKSCYTWNILSSFIVSCKVSVFILFGSLTNWLGY